MANNEPAGKSAAAAKPAAPRTTGADSAKAGTASGAAATPTGRTLTVTVPLDRAIDIATLPVKTAGRILTAKGGLPIYVGLGVLAVADVIDWPVAAAAGAGYAVLRRWGPLRLARTATSGQKVE